MNSVDDARWFAWGLAAVALAALAVRVVYILLERKDIDFGGDAYFYHAGANLLVDGKGFISPFAEMHGRTVQSADHPPLYLLYLAIPSALGMTSALTHLLWSSFLGTATVVIVGLLGREVGGARAGIIAAGLAALAPSIWAPDGALEAETMAMFLTALTLLLAYRYLRQPSWTGLALVGASCGAGALSRSELMLLVPLLLVPLALLTREVTLEQRWRWLGAGVLATVVVIAPWVGHNLTRFERPVFLSAQFEPLIASANCDTTYFGSFIGYFSIPCATKVLEREGVENDDESEQAVAYRSAAVDYVKNHAGRLPLVISARVGRTVGVFKPDQQIHLEALLGGRELWVARWSMYGFYALAVLSVLGAIAIRRRRRAQASRPGEAAAALPTADGTRDVALYPLLSVPAAVLITVIVTYANLRFRAPADIALAVLAAVAVDTGISWAADRRRTLELVDATAPD